jgi:PST family polysaccharide transporter
VNLSAAGIYELVLRISGASLLFFSLTVTTYFIPKVSGLKGYQEVTAEIKSVYKIMLPIVLIVLVGIFICKNFIIQILANSSFLPAATLFKYQLIGDFFKVCAQIFSFALVARAKVWWVIIIDTCAILVQIALTYILVPLFGVEGAAMAYMCLFILYFITFGILFLMKKIK